MLGRARHRLSLFFSSDWPEPRVCPQVSVVDELGLPVKFVGVGETADDLQPFDPVSFVDALFPKTG